jgi:acetyl esterase
MAVGGDSAGGTLATVCAVLARDAGCRCACNCCSTRAAPPTRTRLARRYHQGLVLEQVHIEYFFGQYIDRASARTGASPR